MSMWLKPTSCMLSRLLLHGIVSNTGKTCMGGMLETWDAVSRTLAAGENHSSSSLTKTRKNVHFLI